MNKLLLLGSVVAACPPKKQGGTERVAYYQAKQLALHNLDVIFVGGFGTESNFREELDNEGSDGEKILSHFAFIEIGGGTQFGNAENAKAIDPSYAEASRRMRMENINLAYVQQILFDYKDQYSVVLNNLRGATTLIQTADILKKRWINVMHLNMFDELAEFYQKYHTGIISIARHQKEAYPDLNHVATIYNPIHTRSFEFNNNPKGYALMLGTIGLHKNQKDAILASQKAGIPLVLAGKIRDSEYFLNEIKPHIDGDSIQYVGELNFEEKMRLYREASVFLFPVKWSEPFGLVAIEALACGTPVIAYPNGGPSEIVRDGYNGFLVKNTDEMALRIQEIGSIKREDCRNDVEERFDEVTVGNQYFEALKKVM